MFACKIRNPGFGIQNWSSTVKGRNPVPGIWNPRCGIQSPRLGFPCTLTLHILIDKKKLLTVISFFLFFFRHKGNMNGTNMELAVPIFLFWTQNTSTLQQRCHWMSSMTYTGKVWNRHTHLWRKHERTRPKGHNAIKLYKRAKVHPTTTTKHSSHKCCAAALFNNRSDNSKDWTFHVFPKNSCRRLISPLSTAHVHLL